MESLSFEEMRSTNGGNQLAYWEALSDSIAAMNRAQVGSSAWEQALGLRNSIWMAMEDLGYL